MTSPIRTAPRHQSGRVAEWTVYQGIEIPLRYSSDAAREYEALRSVAGLADASWRGVIDFRGERARDVLGRVTSARVEELSPGRGQLACLLSAKGRLLATFVLVELGSGELRACLHEPLRDEIVREFEKYAFLDDVDVLARAEDLGLLSLLGPASADLLSPWCPDAPGLGLCERRCVDVDGADVTLVRTGGRAAEDPEGGFDLIVDGSALDDVWRSVRRRVEESGGTPLGWQALEALRIEHGVARYGLDWDESRFPSEVGWDHALRYDKCYVGQEVVARMKTYGSANRGLVRLEPESGDPPPPGTLVLEGEEEVGRVTSSCRYRCRGRPLALALVKRRSLGREKLRLALPGATVSSPVSDLASPVVE